MKGVFVHHTATVEKHANIGKGTKIWHYAHVREFCDIGKNSVLGHCGFVDTWVKIGDNVKMGNKVSVFRGVTIEDDVLVGPHVTFTNDLYPRSGGEWKIIKTLVRKGASIGANSTIICGVTIGSHAMVGGGSVVTKDIPDHGMVYGNPAKLKGFVCLCGDYLEHVKRGRTAVEMRCHRCRKTFKIGIQDYKKLER